MTKYRFDVLKWNDAIKDWEPESMGAAPSEEAVAAMLRSVADHLDPPKPKLSPRQEALVRERFPRIDEHPLAGIFDSESARREVELQQRERGK